MSAGFYDTHTCWTNCPQCGYRLTVTVPTYTTASTGYWEASNKYTWTNYRSTVVKVSKAVANSIAQLARMAAFGISPLPAPPNKRKDAALRQAYQHRKVHIWPTLNERRMAWGTR